MSRDMIYFLVSPQTENKINITKKYSNTYINVVKSLLEGESHTTTDDQSIDLIKHVLDQLDLIRDLGTTEDGKERTLRVLKSLGKVFEFLLHEETSSALGKIDTNHGRVSTVSGTESIVNIDIGKGSQRSAELLDGLSISLDLLTISVLGRTFFFDVVTEILQKDDLTTGGGLTGLLNFRTNTVVEEVNGLTQELLNLSGNRLKRVFGDSLTIGTTQVGHQDNGSSTLFKSILDGGKSLNNTVVVGDFTILQGDVEVDTLYTQKEKRIMLVNLHVK